MADKPLKILALDLGRKCGWAAGHIGGGCDSGIWGLHYFKPDRNESRGMLWHKFTVWLCEMFMEYKPGLVVYEKPHHRGGAATEILIGFTTRVQEICEIQGREYATCHTGTLKKFATGMGNANKVEMLEAAREKWGDGVSDDNVADALWLLEWAKVEFGGTNA